MKKNRKEGSLFNNKIQLVITIVLFNVILIYGQPTTTFQKTYGGSGDDIGLSAQQTTDGGYILFGQTWSFGNGLQDMYLVKTNEEGNELWSKTFGGADFEFGISVQQTRDSGFILCGSYGGVANDSLSLIKVGPQGNEIWNKKYSGSINRDVGQFVQQTLDGGFIAVGFTGEFPNEDIYLVKTDNDGNEEWSKVYKTSAGAQHASSVRQTEDGGYIIIGDSNISGSGDLDMYVVKTDNSGEMLWTKTYGTTSDEIGRSLYITDDGGFVLLGYEDTDEGNLYMIKTDNQGNEQWSNYYGGLGKDIGNSVQQTLDGGYILSGRKENTASQIAEMYCLKTDNLGLVEWESTFPRGLLSDSNSVQQTSDNGFIVFGYTLNEDDFTTDMYLVKIDEGGVLSAEDNSLKTLNSLTYPNPFTNYTTVKLENRKGNNKYSVMLHNSQGQLVKFMDNITTNEIRIKRDNLPSGIYFYQVLDINTGSFTTGKLLIN